MNAEAISKLESEVRTLSTEVKKLSGIMETLIRIEERLIGQKDDVDGFGKRLNHFDERLRAAEKQSAVGATTAKLIERGLWGILTGAVAYIAHLFGGK